MYVYINSEPGLYTVGFYKPDGKWEPESDHGSKKEAADRVPLAQRRTPAEPIARRGPQLWGRIVQAVNGRRSMIRKRGHYIVESNMGLNSSALCLKCWDSFDTPSRHGRASTAPIFDSPCKGDWKEESAVVKRGFREAEQRRKRLLRLMSLDRRLQKTATKKRKWKKTRCSTCRCVVGPSKSCPFCSFRVCTKPACLDQHRNAGAVHEEPKRRRPDGPADSGSRNQLCFS
jgi:hypothetical protein